MFFKKKKISKKVSSPLKVPYILGVIWATIIFFLGMFVVRWVSTTPFQVFDFAASQSGSILDFTGQWSSGASEQYSSDDITYILLTWRGWWNHDAPDLTDTIILLWIDPRFKTFSLFSIPRDLYVEYPNSTRTGKINQIYETFLPLWEDIAIERLKSKVSEITGKTIDYYVNIDFQGFIEVVDILWWVEVTLEQNFVDYKYPDNNLGYKTFVLRKWTWVLDGEVALMYARSRHSTSDFDRSIRQQQIISSLREKVSTLWYFSDRKTILALYNIFSEYVETDLSFSEIVKLWLLIRSWDSSQTLSFNLNDSCYDGSPSCNAGWLLYVPLREYFSGASVLLPKDASSNDLSNYTYIQKYTNLIYSSTDMYSDPKNIIIFNATNTSLLARELAETLRPYWFSIDKNDGTQTLREKKFEKSILYYNSISKDDSTLQALSLFLDIEMQETQIPLYSPTGTHIEIVLADTDSF